MQKVIIIGATSGIGKKLAELYAEKGCKVGISGRRSALLEEIRNAYLDNIEAECFDVTGDQNIEMLKSLINKIGGVDILIYNSGVGEPSKRLDWELDKMTTQINVNGFIEICNWTFNYFAEHNKGRLAVISSVASNRGNSWAPAYSASKVFQRNYFEGLSIKAKRLKKDIGITCILPGFVETKMVKDNKTFWLVPLEKACRQIIEAIEKKKREAYISKQWWLVGLLMRWCPYWLYKRIG